MNPPAALRALAWTAAVTGLVSGASAQCFEGVGALVGHGDDSPLQAIQPLGIVFPFGGATYTDVHINNNGMVYLSNGGVPAPGTATGYSSSSATTLSTNLRSGTQAKICAFWDDLNNVVANGGGVMIDNTLGNRCVISWDNTVEFGQTEQKDVQIVLWDTGAIDFVYNAGCRVQTGLALVGVGLGGDVDPGQSNLSDGLTSLGATAYEVFSPSANPFDLDGKALRFTPNNGGFDVSFSCVPASTSTMGVGCGSQASSFYELFSGVADDLTGVTLSAVENANGGYDVASAPLSTFVLPTSVGLGVGDDTLSASQPLGFAWEFPGGVATDVVVDSNGRVLLVGTDASDFSPSVSELLNDPVAQIAVSWSDLRADGVTNTNNVFFETDGVGEARITWLNVPHFTAANGSVTVQLVLLHTGTPGGDRFELRCQQTPVAGNRLIGFSAGNGAKDPGASDLTLGVSTTAEVGNVALSMSAPPVAGTVVTLDTVNMPASTALALTIVGVVPDVPGTELLPGAPGCFVYLTLVGGELVLMPVLLPSDSVGLSIPVDPFFLGVDFYSQTVCFAPVNALSAVTSNAVHGQIQAF